ncbi:class E sortase [Streptomyces sp. t39]|uniref:class E sortase n=1 Tax=Streptomyces sp. t39 TaxID=1828156 RepID=UPI0011CDABB5|nr:class E sortase [Streptomyces sp. t39]TXS56015.1 sortase [Streptomyces sp. t39]
MSAGHPGHEHEEPAGHGGEGYDPLTDPLPRSGHGSPWFRTSGVPAEDGPAQEPYVPGTPPRTYVPPPDQEPYDWYDREGYRQDWYGPDGAGGPEAPPAPAPGYPQAPPVPRARHAAVPGPAGDRPAGPGPAVAPGAGLLPGPEAAGEPVPEPVAVPEPAPLADPLPVADDETVALRTAQTRRAAEVPPGPGRAERRRAAKGRGHRRGAPAAAAAGGAAAGPVKPMSRMEARRAAKAAKDSPAVVASRAIGELFITFGVLMLLFVTYQLWWTNVLAGQQADRAASRIQDDWAKGRKPDAFEPGQGFALMYIPKLDVVVPIAEGIDKHKVLDRGMVGHYAEGKLKTAMPEDEQGNFAVAGHRNTHGEPFRYINRLEPGDPIVVETQDTYYTYEMASILPQTMPSNVAVIDPVPRGSGFTKPGRYITLTTCTPEFTSTYRMIVWGKMVEERPRSQGKPDALVG